MKLNKIALPSAGAGVNVSSNGYLSIEFKRRLDAYGKAYNVVITGNGYRSIEAQAQAYLDYQTDPTHHNPAAYPGNSWHNCALAFDVKKNPTTGKYPATMEADYLVTPTQQQMYKWGLCIPMWKNTSEKEPWHVQPIETLGISSDRQKFLDEDDLLDSPSGYRTLKVVDIDNWPADKPLYMIGSDVGIVQKKLVVSPVDKYFGKDTESKVIAFQTSKSLTADGIVGTNTWKALMNPVPEINYKALYEEEKAKVAILSDQIVSLDTQLEQAGEDYLKLNTIKSGLEGELVELAAHKRRDDAILAQH